MLLLSPLGTSLAVIEWQPGLASYTRDGMSRSFADMEQLTAAVLGLPAPLHHLFQWLQGQDNSPEDGWELDLSRHGEGKILARRLRPDPPVELRMILDL